MSHVTSYKCGCGFVYYDVLSYMIHVNHCEGCVDLYREIPLDRVQDCKCYVMVPRCPSTHLERIAAVELAAQIRLYNDQAGRTLIKAEWKGRIE